MMDGDMHHVPYTASGEGQWGTVGCGIGLRRCVASNTCVHCILKKPGRL